jgi:hypothetical protein
MVSGLGIFHDNLTGGPQEGTLLSYSQDHGHLPLQSLPVLKNQLSDHNHG